MDNSLLTTAIIIQASNPRRSFTDIKKEVATTFAAVTTKDPNAHGFEPSTYLTVIEDMEKNSDSAHFEADKNSEKRGTKRDQREARRWAEVGWLTKEQQREIVRKALKKTKKKGRKYVKLLIKKIRPIGKKIYASTTQHNRALDVLRVWDVLHIHTGARKNPLVKSLLRKLKSEAFDSKM